MTTNLYYLFLADLELDLTVKIRNGETLNLSVKPSFMASCFLTQEDPGSGAYKSTSLTRLVGRFPSFLAAVSFNTLLECYPKDTQLQSLVSSSILESIKSEKMNVFWFSW